jgi:hypothetical protein
MVFLFNKLEYFHWNNSALSYNSFPEGMIIWLVGKTA